MPRSKRKKPSQKNKPFYARHWGSNEKRSRTRLWHRIQKAFRIEKPRYWWKERNLGQRIGILFVTAVLVLTLLMYGFAQIYIFKHRNEQLKLGTTFVPNYARYFDLDPKETLSAMMNDLGLRRFRFVSYWSDIEKTNGTYDFSELDWQFEMARQANAEVSLAIGLRQPRWPECHMPNWAREMPKDKWYPELKDFMQATIERYKDHPNLKSYQLENEFFLSVFGRCPDHSRERLIDEFKFVKSLDNTKPVIITRSNNAVPSWPIGEPQPDQSGAAVYKRVWDKTVTQRYFEYPLPSWYYAFFAGATELTTGRNTILHELQAEPWMPPGYDLRQASVAEQNKSMSADMLEKRIEYGKATSLKTIDLWGAEWWYWRKVKGNDPSLWDAAKRSIQTTQNTQAYREGEYAP